MQRGAVLWLTGHSKSGKTTLSRMLHEELQHMGCRSIRLDSDTLPKSIIKPEAESWEERQRLKNENLLFLSRLLFDRGDIVIIASVGRFAHWKEMLRKEIPDFFEIYLKCPLDVRLSRDIDGKYETHRDYFHLYEEPKQPDAILETDQQTAEQSVLFLLSFLHRKGIISPLDPHSG